MSNRSIEQPKVAGNTINTPEPFDSSAKADIILRTSDLEDFYVIKSLLSLVSPVFDAMFSLCQEEIVEKDNVMNGKPVVQIDEDSAALYNFLLLIYPWPI